MIIDPNLVESLRLTAEACLKAVELIQQAQEENKYVSLDAAAAALGSGISPEMLKERCADGRFAYGVHFINTSDGKRGNYLIKVAAVRKFFETDPSRRPLRRVV